MVWLLGFAIAMTLYVLAELRDARYLEVRVEPSGKDLMLFRDGRFWMRFVHGRDEMLRVRERRAFRFAPDAWQYVVARIDGEVVRFRYL